jgi:hypothetical protein
MSQRVIFIEHQEQLSALPKEYFSAQYKIIALSPAACYWLDKNEVAYETLEKYTAVVLPEDEKRIYYEKVNQILFWLDNFLSKNIPESGFSNFAPFKNNFIEFYSNFSCLMRRLRLVDNFFASKGALIEKVFYFSDRFSSFSPLIPLIADKYRTRTEALIGDKRKIKGQSFIEALLIKIKKIELMRKCYAYKLLFTFDTLFLKKKKPRILSLNYTFDVRFAIKDIMRRGERVIIWDPFRIREPFYAMKIFKKIQINNLGETTAVEIPVGSWMQICRADDFLALFEYKGIDFFELVEDELRNYLNNIIPLSFRLYRQTRQLIEKYDLKLLLCAGAYNPFERAILHAFRIKNLPVVVYSHGSM